MDASVSSLTRRAPAILFVLSAIVLVLGLAAAFMTAYLTVQQAGNTAFGPVATSARGVARIQLLGGISTAFHSALWPFAAGALVRAVQARPLP